MKELNPTDQQTKDKVVIVGQKQQEIQQKIIAKINPKRGHTVFEVNLKTHEILPAEFDEGSVDFAKEAKKISPKEGKSSSRDTGLGIIKSKEGETLGLALRHIPKPIKRSINRKPDCVYISALNKKNVYKKLIKLGIIKIVNK